MDPGRVGLGSGDEKYLPKVLPLILGKSEASKASGRTPAAKSTTRGRVCPSQAAASVWFQAACRSGVGVWW